MGKLKLCPFCEGEVFRDFVSDSYTEDIVCNGCDQLFRMSDEEWNRRAIPDPWISVEDRLPEEKDADAFHLVWVFVPKIGFGVTPTKYIRVKHMADATHWMARRKPQPPKKG